MLMRPQSTRVPGPAPVRILVAGPGPGAALSPHAAPTAGLLLRELVDSERKSGAWTELAL